MPQDSRRHGRTRARGCPGWFVAPSGTVTRCEVCEALPAEGEATRSARAAGLEVGDDGLVVGVPRAAPTAGAPRSEQYRATVSANDLLIAVLEHLMDVTRLEHLPGSLRSAVDHLAIEVAKVQGVSEWVAEDLVTLVEDGLQGEGA